MNIRDEPVLGEQDIINIITPRFMKEWDGTTKVPYLSSLIKPGSSMNAATHLLSLDTNSPFGNLTLNWISILARIRLINETIDKINSDFKTFTNHLDNPSVADVINDPDIYSRQQMSGELLVYQLKTLVDRTIMLLSLLQSKGEQGLYPDSIEVDNIGIFLSKKAGEFGSGKFDKFKVILESLNIVANSYKHSFLNAQASNILARNTPGVITFYHYRNKSKNDPVFAYLFFSNTVREIDKFMSVAKEYLACNK